MGKILRATHKLWMARNEMVHLKTEEGLKGMNMVELHSEVNAELQRGIDLMAAEDYYLMEVDSGKLLLKPLESLRGWLCSVKLARGDTEGAKQEGLNDRGLLSHKLPTLSTGQMRQYHNWNNIQLSD